MLKITIEKWSTGIISIEVYRLSGIHWKSRTYCTACISITVFLIHILSVNLQIEVIIEERRRKIQADIGTAHPWGFNDTVRSVISQTQTVRHIFQTTGYWYIMTMRDSSAEYLILPISISVTHTYFTGFIAPDVINKFTKLITIEYIILFLDHRNCHVTVVRNLRGRTTLTFLSGNNDNTVWSTATVNGSSRSIL